MINEADAKVPLQHKRAIEIRIEAKNYSLGGPVLLVVRYYNRTEHELIFREPSKTWEVFLSVTTNGKETKYPFGRISSSEVACIRRKILEVFNDVTVQAHQSYEFEYNVGQRWPELFLPGTTRICVKDYTDDSETIESNKIEIGVVFDKISFTHLLSILEDDKATNESRIFACTWIAKLYKDFIFNVNTNSEAEKNENQKNITKAKSWWDNHKTDSRVGKVIDNLNHIK